MSKAQLGCLEMRLMTRETRKGCQMEALKSASLQRRFMKEATRVAGRWLWWLKENLWWKVYSGNV